MIVGVAIKIGDYIQIRLPRPHRHADCFNYFCKTTGVRAPSLGLRTSGENQGFYTDTGAYLNRKHAMAYAIKHGQEFRPDPRDGEITKGNGLLSEDLW